MIRSTNIAELQITSIIEMIAEKDKPVFFDTPVIVKPTPHSEIYRCYACVVNKDGNLMLMDANEEWQEIKVGEANASYLIGSLFQRLKLLNMG